MVQGFTSNELSNENEEDLITLVANYLQSYDGRSKLPCSFISTTNKSTVEIKTEKCQQLFNCDHEEADTRLMFHAISANQGIIVNVLIR